MIRAGLGIAASLALLAVVGCKKKPVVAAEVPPLPPSVDRELQLVSVSPSGIEPNTPTTVVLFGSGFSRSAAVQIGSVAAMSVTFRSENQLEVVLPSLEAGTFDVYVENSDGDRDSLKNALQVRPSGGSACHHVVLYFDTGQAKLTVAAETTLTALIDCYNLSTGPIRVAGHADERGTTDFNLALSYRRALIVQAYLVAGGIPTVRLPVSSYGEERPAEGGWGESIWARNRRVELQQD